MHNLQWRLLLPLSIFLALSLTGLGLFLGFTYHDNQVNGITQRLTEEATIVSHSILSQAAAGTEIDSLVKRLGSGTDIRITVIGADGTVLGDSIEDPSKMENHTDRPEVCSALSTGYGESVRYSSTLGYEMKYVAVSMVNADGSTVGVSRVALPLSEVQLTTRSIVETVAITIAVSLIIILAGLWIMSRVITMPIRQLTRDVKRITGGEAGVTTAVTGPGEIGELGKALNAMSTRLSDVLSELASEKDRLESILSRMADGVILSDPEGRVAVSNQAAADIFGFDSTEANGKPVIEAVRDFEVDELLRKVLKTGSGSSSRFETMLNHRFLRAISEPISYGTGKGALLLFQDFTELRELQTTRRDLIGNISHEFRTPLAGIRAIVETLEDSAMAEPEVARDFLSKIRDEVDRLTQMVAELTDLSRMETGRTELKKQKIDLGQTINEVIAQLVPLANRSSVSIEYQPAEKLPGVMADAEKIQRVITNLVHNAIKFTPPGGKISITTRATQNEAVVSVADTGVGIIPADLPHVFERFFKADRARAAGGTGLGLAIVKHTIQAHGGRVWAESEPGKGSTFSFSLPFE